MADETLLLVHTPRQRFLASNADIYTIRAGLVEQEPAPNVVQIGLGAFFDPADVSMLKRQHGMVVPLRRKEITFLVDRIDLLEIRPQRYELPPLLVSRLRAPWALGAFAIDDQLVVHLDMRALARSVLSAKPSHG